MGKNVQVIPGKVANWISNRLVDRRQRVLHKYSFVIVKKCVNSIVLQGSELGSYIYTYIHICDMTSFTVYINNSIFCATGMRRTTQPFKHILVLT